MKCFFMRRLFLKCGDLLVCSFSNGAYKFDTFTKIRCSLDRNNVKHLIRKDISLWKIFRQTLIIKCQQ